MATNKNIASHLMEIPEDLLSEIFLRLRSADDLARTSAACVSFRRLVTDRSFLRSFRRLHARPLLGFFDHNSFHPAFLPHPSAPAARALTLAADLSFSFLPSHCRWTVCDTRDGRVLLDGTPVGQERPVFPELVICDPLHQRYILLPPVPDNLVPMVPAPRSIYWSPCKPSLVPLGEEETDTAFRVIWMDCRTKLSAFVFSSSTGEWRTAASKAWTDLVVDKCESDIMSKAPHFLVGRHYAYGCFYWDWLLTRRKKLLVLDTRRMEFSMADLPPGEWSTKGLAIVEAGEGRLGIFGFRRGSTSAGLSYIIARTKGESPSQWQIEKKILLDPGYKYGLKDATERYLLLKRKEKSSQENPRNEYFSMDIKTLQHHRVCPKQGMNTYWKRIYANFPPSLLSSPTI